jgi:hypothetical protein
MNNTTTCTTELPTFADHEMSKYWSFKNNVPQNTSEFICSEGHIINLTVEQLNDCNWCPTCQES